MGAIAFRSSDRLRQKTLREVVLGLGDLGGPTQVVATAISINRAGKIVSMMCLDQFSAITSSKDTRSAVRAR
jgi:hypothetical protein